MKNSIRIATCVAAAVTLSGCQSFVSALGFGPRDHERRAEATTPVFGNSELERGRAALKAGYPGNAIAQFRLAALNEKAAPDAFNGMAVAYAKLGRADLAERYFKMAVSLDSANPKFAANLQRFYESPLGNSSRALAMREKEAEAQLAAVADAASAQGLLAAQDTSERRGAVTIERPAVQMTRTSGRELLLSTAGPADDANSTGRMAEVTVRNPAKSEPEPRVAKDADKEDLSVAEEKRKAPAQISMLGATEDSRSYPVRISLTKPDGPAKSQAPRTGSYPLRVALKPSNIAE